MDSHAMQAVARMVALVLAESGFEAAEGKAACWLQELAIECTQARHRSVDSPQ